VNSEPATLTHVTAKCVACALWVVDGWVMHTRCNCSRIVSITARRHHCRPQRALKRERGRQRGKVCVCVYVCARYTHTSARDHSLILAVAHATVKHELFEPGPWALRHLCRSNPDQSRERRERARSPEYPHRSLALRQREPRACECLLSFPECQSGHEAKSPPPNVCLLCRLRD
jgi:hypothetical protein